MNRAILAELNFFIASFFWGVFLFFIYDCLLIFRNIIKHNRVITAIEDIVFWVVSSVLIFQMMYTKNHGTIRWYFIIGLALGMIAYRNTLSSMIVTLITTVTKKIIALIHKVLAVLFKPLRFVLKTYSEVFTFCCKKVQATV